MPRNKPGQSDADLCREMGWGVGQHLIGDEGYGPSVICITAVGESSILARRVYPSQDAEKSWTLMCRDWQPHQS